MTDGTRSQPLLLSQTSDASVPEPTLDELRTQVREQRQQYLQAIDHHEALGPWSHSSQDEASAHLAVMARLQNERDHRERARLRYEEARERLRAKEGDRFQTRTLVIGWVMFVVGVASLLAAWRGH